jgi:hypothetical protein
MHEGQTNYAKQKGNLFPGLLSFLSLLFFVLGTGRVALMLSVSTRVSQQRYRKGAPCASFPSSAGLCPLRACSGASSPYCGAHHRNWSYPADIHQYFSDTK